jgi:hypothetical protein
MHKVRYHVVFPPRCYGGVPGIVSITLSLPYFMRFRRFKFKKPGSVLGRLSLEVIHVIRRS